MTAEIDYLNEVRIRGRVAADPASRVLPSGDELLTLRVVVGRGDRPARGRDGPGATSRSVVDTLDVACWSAATRRAAGRCVAGDVVEVEGALRRRFFRSGGSPASRYEVEARSLRRAKGGAKGRAESRKGLT